MSHLISSVGADPRHGSAALGPWGDSPLTIFTKGNDDFSKGKGILGRIKVLTMARQKASIIFFV